MPSRPSPKQKTASVASRNGGSLSPPMKMLLRRLRLSLHACVLEAPQAKHTKRVKLGFRACPPYQCFLHSIGLPHPSRPGSASMPSLGLSSAQASPNPDLVPSQGPFSSIALSSPLYKMPLRPRPLGQCLMHQTNFQGYLFLTKNFQRLDIKMQGLSPSVGIFRLIEWKKITFVTGGPIWKSFIFMNCMTWP